MSASKKIQKLWRFSYSGSFVFVSLTWLWRDHTVQDSSDLCLRFVQDSFWPFHTISPTSFTVWPFRAVLVSFEEFRYHFRPFTSKVHHSSPLFRRFRPFYDQERSIVSLRWIRRSTVDTNLGRWSDEPWKEVLRILDGGPSSLRRWSYESWTEWSWYGHDMVTVWSWSRKDPLY